MTTTKKAADTTDEPSAAVVEATLRNIHEKYGNPPADTLAKLPKPYKKDSPKGNCDVCGKYHGLPALHLDYMGHAEVTLALIDIDPDWNWEPMAIDPATGGPLIGVQDRRLVMWGRLTVLGKTMPGVGTCETAKSDPEKELIGDFLRNAAMRFGVGTKLWSKADSADPAGSGPGGGYEERDDGRTFGTGQAQSPVGAIDWHALGWAEEPIKTDAQAAAAKDAFESNMKLIAVELAKLDVGTQAQLKADRAKIIGKMPYSTAQVTTWAGMVDAALIEMEEAAAAVAEAFDGTTEEPSA